MGKIEIDSHLTIEVVDRMTWGELERKTNELIVPKHPFRWIRFAYNDLGREKDQDIAEALKKWEKAMMIDMQLPDVPYNFLINTDGVVYEGRGWYWDADRPVDYLDVTTKCLDICYIGDYTKNQPPWNMLYIAHNLILYGLRENLLWEEVRVMPYTHQKCERFV